MANGFLNNIILKSKLFSFLIRLWNIAIKVNGKEHLNEVLSYRSNERRVNVWSLKA
jgi:hypothetical protein